MPNIKDELLKCLTALGQAKHSREEPGVMMINTEARRELLSEGWRALKEEDMVHPADEILELTEVCNDLDAAIDDAIEGLPIDKQIALINNLILYVDRIHKPKTDYVPLTTNIGISENSFWTFNILCACVFSLPAIGWSNPYWYIVAFELFIIGFFFSYFISNEERASPRRWL